MATKTVEVWTCDRCGKEGEHYNTLGVIWFWIWQRREVCRTCYDQFGDWFFHRKALPVSLQAPSDKGE